MKLKCLLWYSGAQLPFWERLPFPGSWRFAGILPSSWGRKFMSTAVHHCPFSTHFAWVIFFFYLSAPYLSHDFPWSIPSFSSTQIHFLWTTFSFSYRIPSSLPSISSSQSTWVHILYWRKNPSDLVAAELKEIARNVLLLSHTFRQDLAFAVKIIGYPHLWSFYWLTKILIMQPYLRFLCWSQSRPRLIFSPVL